MGLQIPSFHADQHSHWEGWLHGVAGVCHAFGVFRVLGVLRVFGVLSVFAISCTQVASIVLGMVATISSCMRYKTL